MNLSRRKFARDLSKSLLYLAAGPAIVRATLDDMADTVRAQDVVPNRKSAKGGGGAAASLLPGMTSWYKADAIVGFTNGQTATNWPDSSGNGNNIASGTGLYNTNVQNGLPGISASSCNFLNPDGATYLTFTHHVVWKSAASTNHIDIINASNCFWVIGALSGNHAFYDGNGWFQGPAVAANTMYVTTITQIASGGGKGCYMRTNGSATASDTATPGGMIKVGFVGGGCDTSGAFSGFVFEEVFYGNLALTTPQSVSNEAVLRSKWGF